MIILGTNMCSFLIEKAVIRIAESRFGFNLLIPIGRLRKT